MNEMFMKISKSRLEIESLINSLYNTNILLNDGVVKLADFGFCRSLKSKDELAHTMLGSPIYMAPEILRGFDYS